MQKTFSRQLPLQAACMAFLLLVAGCGFHLQGRLPVPELIRSVYLDVEDPQSEFYRALRASLTASGAHVLDQPDPAAAVLHVTKDKVTERVLTVSTRNVPTDYELTYLVEFGVDRAGHEYIAPEELTLTRVYSFNETTLLAKNREKQLLSDALARDMASVVMRRLASL